MEQSAHEQKEQERLSKQEEREKEQQAKLDKKQFGSTLKKVMVFLIFAAVIYYLYQGYSNREPPFTAKPVHWHADLEILICGQAFTDLQKLGSGSTHAGSPLLHTHGDSVIHIEGQPFKAEQISLGRFLDGIGYRFSETELLDKKNGDLCSGQPGKVRMTVNGQENFEYRNYVIKGTSNAVEQKIRLVFE